ncbi:DUF1697 domain-containing protein [Haladaptatus pallidirubidus]|uniref:DUF1697 domain-containing protein n=1 Tax=Haladaptatus pallidirubidus TaxID=1008152 RepID=A0AAV3UNY7_9EURY|nr:DUF1697 domain-containing protein [Haladaptatus pallidirubidus]
MTTYIVFLRGINVGAHNRMKMTDLRALFESLNYENVQTYIQSGNVVFETDVNKETIRSDVSDAIADTFGYDIAVMVRTSAELADVVDNQPFDEPDNDFIKRYVTFLNEEPTDKQREKLLDAQSEAESFEIRGRNVYSQLNKAKLGDGRFTDTGKKLGMPVTRRAWNVVTAVLELQD